MDDMDNPDVTKEIRRQGIRGQLIRAIDEQVRLPIKPSKSKDAWVIMYRGQQVVLLSTNKSVWKARGYAMNALTQKVKSSFDHYLRDEYGISSHQEIVDIYRKTLADLIEDGTIEFRCLSTAPLCTEAGPSA